MKKSGLALALALVLAAGIGNADATKFRVALWGGFGSASGGAVNDTLDTFAGVGGADVTEVSTAAPIGLEGTYEVIENLAIGLRLGYITANEGKASVGDPAILSLDLKYGLSAMPIMVGGRYSFPLDEKLSLNGGLFAGIATVTLDTELGMTFLGIPLGSSAESDTGGGVAAEFLLGAAYKLAPNWALGLDVGYRIISVKAETYDGTEDTIDLNGVSGLLSIAYLF